MGRRSEFQGYDQDFFAKDEYEHKQEYYENDGYCQDSSSMQMVRPRINTPQPVKHYVVGHDQSYGHNQESQYGKQSNYHDHGYPGGKSHKMSDGGMYGRTHHGFYGQQSPGYQQSQGYIYPAKPSHGKHQSTITNVEYENHHEYLHKGPAGGYESTTSYGYYGEERDRCPPYYEQQPMHSKNWSAAKGDAEWVSKGI